MYDRRPLAWKGLIPRHPIFLCSSLAPLYRSSHRLAHTAYTLPCLTLPPRIQQSLAVNTCITSIFTKRAQHKCSQMINLANGGPDCTTTLGPYIPRLSRRCSLVFGFSAGWPPPRASVGNCTCFSQVLVMYSAASLWMRCCSSVTRRRPNIARSGCPFFPSCTEISSALRRLAFCKANHCRYN